jgi:hypothetical protein
MTRHWPLTMARYRIIRRPSRVHADTYVYDIEERWLFWWQSVSVSWLSFEAAEQGLEEIRQAALMDAKPKVIKEYD